MKKLFKVQLSIFVLIITQASLAQVKPSRVIPNDSLSYNDVIAKSITQRGLITFHQSKNKYYLEITNNILSKELLVVTRIERGTNPGYTHPIYPGDEINNMVVIFEKAPNNTLLLRKSIFSNYAGDSTSPFNIAVIRSDFRPILASFPIIVWSKDSTSFMVDVTAFLQADNEVVSFSKLKAVFLLASLEPDKSYINHILAFPNNVEISTVKTFLYGGPGNSPISTEDLSFEINTSIILLPATPYKQRFKDNRIGYFSLHQTDYNENPDGIKSRNYITHWRIEPKPDEIEKYEKGELVEPVKPIVFYIDPAVPKKWVPYLIKAVNAWQPAFEQAGFKNAIYAREAPSWKEDSTWSLNDARHSAIVYKPSEIKNAYGPIVSDPRTGEILESHICFYHNVIQLVHDWYMTQCGAVDPAARKMFFDDSLTGKLIEAVITHEVGHALGLMHNFAASSTVPTDSLRSKYWLNANGICPSIMDYARFNYVAQPEDHISEKGLFPTVGIYDKWAIEWGYKWLPQFPTPESEKHYLNEWATQKLTDKRLVFGSENSFDSHAQSEDLGDDAIKASAYGISNLKKTLPLLPQWAIIPDEGYEKLNDLYSIFQDQFLVYIQHVGKNIWGVYETLKHTNQGGPVYTPIPYEYQKKSIQFLNANLFQTPEWLMDTIILNRTGQTGLGVISKIQDAFFRSLFFEPHIYSLIGRQQSNYGNRTYTLIQLFADLNKYIWTELNTHRPIDLFRQSLQLHYCQYLIQIFRSIGINTDVQIILPNSGHTSLGAQETLAIIKMNLLDIGKSIKKALPFMQDKATIYHLQFLLDKMSNLHGDARFW